MLHMPLIKCEVHQAAFVHSKTLLGTSGLTQHYLLVMWECDFWCFNTDLNCIYIFPHFDFSTKTAIPNTQKILARV